MVSPSHDQRSPFLVSSLRMEKEWDNMTERILNFTLEIIYLLTGEDYGPVKNLHDQMMPSSHNCVSTGWSSNPITTPLSISLKLEQNHQIILKVIQKIVNLLTEEVPIRSQDVAVYLSMEEWEYLEGHKDLYNNVTIDNRSPLTSPDGSTNNPERCRSPLYSRDSTQKHQELQDEELESKEDPSVIGNGWCKKEKLAEISPDDDVEEQGIQPSPEDVPLNLNLQKENLSLDPPTCKGCFANNFHPAANDTTSKEGKNPPCPQCGGCQRTHIDECYAYATSGNPIAQKTHFIGHNTDKKCYSCSECGKQFAKKSTLLKHQIRHQEEKPHSCSKCSKCFTKKSNLVRHQRMHTGEKPYSCPDCEKSFTWKPSLEHHLRKHRGEVPFLCSECGKCFAQKSYFQQHQRTHKGKEPYSCSKCGECFAKKSVLVIHQRTHTSEKLFSCTECGKYFVQKCTLMDHLKMHSGEKSYSCTECGKTFQWRSSLFYHERMHKGLKPLSCSECGKGFAQKSHLVQHQKMHAGQKTFEF